MGEFKDSFWADREFSENYLEKADIFIPDRQRMFLLAAEYAMHHFGSRKKLSMCDLGSGDGAASVSLLNVKNFSRATFVDASSNMLDKARERFKDRQGSNYIISEFDDIIDGNRIIGEHDMFISAQAIHHLSMDRKTALFKIIYNLLKPGGLFINIDAVLPETPELEEFHLRQWEGQMRNKAESTGLAGFDPKDVIAKFKSPESNNQPDTLEDQLKALRGVGFSQVSCYFKNHIFAVFGGCK